MRNSKIFKAMAVAAPVLLSANILADTVTAIANFTTVADVQIAEAVSVEFGDSIIPIAGRSCVLTATATTTAATAAGVTPTATVAGDGCDDASTAAAAGIYPITGAPSSSIIITTAVSANTTDYTFTAEGTYFNESTLTPTINTTGASTVTLSAGGLGLIVMGGELDINVDLAFSTALSATYDIDVTY